jgi:transcriptional regulator with PAS, ATPase and Fis domain
LETKVNSYKKEINNLFSAKYNLEDIVGSCELIINLKKLALVYARTEAPVLIIGETGTGKELFAHAVHNSSGRSRGPFVCLNCASIPKELLESELFGYAPGAFTGAHPKGKMGKIELADGGTLFLDEIGDLPPSAQAKLLRVLEEKRVEKVGDVHPIEIDFRLVAATNKDLELLIKEAKFRKDLYYRLGTMTLFIPSLRNRADDISLLARFFTKELGGISAEISDQALDILKKYSWPGNIRELKNVIGRALSLLDENEMIDVHHLPPQIFRRHIPGDFRMESRSVGLKDIVFANEEKTIQEALNSCGGNKVKAAKLLKISRSVLYNKMKRYKIHF